MLLAFLKKACEDHTLGTSGDGSEIHYPSLPPFGENDHNEEEKKTESKRKVVTPPPGFRIDHEEVCLHSSSVPRLLRYINFGRFPCFQSIVNCYILVACLMLTPILHFH